MFYCQENRIESLTISKVSTNLALLIDRQVKTTNNTTFEAVSFSDVTFIIHDIYIICFMMIISFFVICVWTGLTLDSYFREEWAWGDDLALDDWAWDDNWV